MPPPTRTNFFPPPPSRSGSSSSSFRGGGGGGGDAAWTHQRYGKRWRGTKPNAEEEERPTAADKSKDRKQRRRAERDTKKRQRIEAQAQWSAQRREAREARLEEQRLRQQEQQQKQKQKQKQNERQKQLQMQTDSLHRQKSVVKTTPSLTAAAASKKRTSFASKTTTTAKKTDHEKHTRSHKQMRLEEEATLDDSRKAYGRSYPASGNSSDRDSDDYSDDDDEEYEEGDRDAMEVSSSLLASEEDNFVTSSEEEEEPEKKRDHHHNDKEKKRAKDNGQEQQQQQKNTTKSGASLSSLSPAALAALEKFKRTERNDVPPALVRLMHACVNKLTITNVISITQDVADVFRSGSVSTNTNSSISSPSNHKGTSTTSVPVSRSMVVACLMDEVDRWGCMDTGNLSTLTAGLPFAGLLRGLQLLGGDVVSADIVERLCRSLQQHVVDGEENGSSSATMLLALLYLLCGVDATLITSLLRAFLTEGEREGIPLPTKDNFKEEEEGHDQSLQRHQEAASDVPLSERVLCAASCALTLLRACGEKLLKESPTEMDVLVQHAKRVSSQLHGRPGATRYAALVQVMLPIVRGHTKTAKRSQTESDAPIERMFQELKVLLPQYTTASGKPQGPQQQRLLVRMIQTAHALAGVTFDQVLQEEKPPQWWVPGTMDAATTKQPKKKNTNKREEDEEEAKGLTSEERKYRRKVFGEDEDEDEEENDEDSEDEEERKYAEKQREIKRMRAEEKAASGQRFNTEHTRDIFRCLTAATDDLDAFTMLMHRDPQYTRFQDVCKVILQCCVQEKRYNPFYANVLERFCHARRACRTVLQFALWDYFKGVRLQPRADVCGFVNIASCIASLVENEVITLSVLRGLDLEETNKTIGLLARIILLRLLLFLSPKRFTTVFFGGDGRVALDFKTDTSALREKLEKLLQLYFDEAPERKKNSDKKRKRPAVAEDEDEDGDAGETLSPTSVADTKWLRAMYDVVAIGTDFDIYAAATNTKTSSSSAAAAAAAQDKKAMSVEESLAAFQKRVRVARKALQQGLW